MTGPPVEPDDGERGPPPERDNRPTSLGLTTFTIEGRSAPALFVVGWIAGVLGLGMVVAGSLGGSRAVLVVGLFLLAVGLVSGAGSQAIERRARGADEYRGPSPVLVFAATIPVAYFVALVVGAVLSALGVTAQRAVSDLLLVTIQGAVTVGLVSLLVVGTRALSWRELGLAADARRAVGDVAWGAVFAGPVILVTAIVSGILVGILGEVPESPLPPTGETTGLVLHLIAGAIIAPVAEEVLFRGVATTAWVRTYGVWRGIIRAAVFFALAHVLLLGGADLQQAVAIAIVGFAGRLPVALALGWVYIRRRSLWAAIGLHSTFNGILIVLAHVTFGAGGAGGS